MLRSFIAIEIPTEIQQAIMRETAGLRQALKRPLVRWVAMENIHLTLKFLGDVSPSNLENLAGYLTTELNKYSAFTITVGGIGAFPNQRRPRVIWIGLQAPNVLASIFQNIESVAAQFGFAPETHPISPHLTIGRVNQHASAVEIQKICAGLEHVKVGLLGNTIVNGIHIFRSDLQPTGAVYTNLHTIPFSAQ